jgi:neurotrimin
VPPKINEEKSTINPAPIREGQSLTLYCHAEGIPTPSVSWYFRKRLTSPMHHLTNEHSDHKSIKLHETNTIGEKIFQEGNTLFIQNITRSHSGIFECIANNSVPPAASRKIKVTVECKSLFFFVLKYLER